MGNALNIDLSSFCVVHKFKFGMYDYRAGRT